MLTSEEIDQVLDEVSGTIAPAEVRPDPDEPATITGAAHPVTSHIAAERVLPRTGTQRRRILDHLQGIYPEGSTDEEMQRVLEIKHQSQTPRRLELHEMGWIEESGSTRPTASGSVAIVWRAVL